MPVIDLLAGFKEIGSTRGKSGGGGISKMVVDVSAPDFKIDLSDTAMAGSMALAVAEQMRNNVLAGCRLDGTPAKALAQATIERREYRILQGERGGAAAARYKDKAFRADTRKHWRQNYRAARLGTYNPAESKYPANLRAVESGLLLESIVAEPQSDKTWRIFFANVRAQTDRSGGSPVGRAFGAVGERKSMMQRVVSQPSVKKRLESTLVAAIHGKSGHSLLQELSRTANLGRNINEGLNSNNEQAGP